jgi:hypothetical protein
MLSVKEKARISRVKNVHRRLGMVVVLFLILLTATGVLLNHSEDMGLAEKPVSGFFGSLIYDLEDVTSVEAWQVNGKWLYTMNDQLYLEDSPVDYCEGSLVGGIELTQLLVALCSRELIIMDLYGQLVERVSVGDGIPAGVEALARSEKGLILQLSDGLRLFDIDRLESSPWLESDESIEWNSSQPLPDYLLDQLQTSVPEFNLERLILDIHSGRILGSWRQIALDFLAFLILALAVGGMGMMHLRKD